MPFHSVIRGKSKLSEDYSASGQASAVKSAESFDFLLSCEKPKSQKPFCRIIRGKSKLSVNPTAERQAFPQDNPQKVKTRRIIRRKSKLFANYPAEGFSIHGKSKSHFLQAYRYF